MLKNKYAIRNLFIAHPVSTQSIFHTNFECKF
jgi:hypothetical protein